MLEALLNHNSNYIPVSPQCTWLPMCVLHKSSRELLVHFLFSFKVPIFHEVNWWPFKWEWINPYLLDIVAGTCCNALLTRDTTSSLSSPSATPNFRYSSSLLWAHCPLFATIELHCSALLLRDALARTWYSSSLEPIRVLIAKFLWLHALHIITLSPLFWLRTNNAKFRNREPEPTMAEMFP